MPKRGENIYKRKDGRYEGRYVIGQTDDGRTRFGYVYGRQYTSVRNTLLCKKAEMLENRGPNASSPISIEQWMEGWIGGEMQSRLKASSLQTYERLYRHHIKPHIGQVDIAALTVKDLYEYMAVLSEKKLSLATQGSVFRLLSAAMRLAAEEGLIRRNPCTKIHLRNEKPEQRVMTVSEHARLRDAAIASKNIPVLLGLYTGMRLGEICALRWSDIDFDARTITVRRTVQRMKKKKTDGQTKTELFISSPKSLSSRRVTPTPDFILNMLEEKQTSSDPIYVFGRMGHAAEPRTIQSKFEKLTHKLSMPDVHFHTTRHTFATRMLQIGVDIKTVSVMLGHSSPKTTLDFYSHSMIDHQRMAVNRLAEDVSVGCSSASGSR